MTTYPLQLLEIELKTLEQKKERLLNQLSFGLGDNLAQDVYIVRTKIKEIEEAITKLNN